ncbi:MAG: ABC transporter ATPase [Flavicella sp.]
MLKDYASLEDNDKVWIYPSSKKIYPKELEVFHSMVTDFLEQWQQEGQDILSAYQLKYNRILVIVTSCDVALKTPAINSLNAFIARLESEFNTVLMDKMNPCFKQGVYVQYKDLKSFKKLIKDKAVTKKTIVFDNMVHTKGEYESYWEIPAEDSWYGHLFK